MKLNMILEAAGDVLYGYRTLPTLELARKAATDGLPASETTETYWSYKPILYLHHPGPNPASDYSNLVEAVFQKDDPGLCGYGDGNQLYQYLTLRRLPSNLEAVVRKLPTQLQREFEDLRSMIVGDQSYADDWSFAGILPQELKQPIIGLIRRAAPHLEWRDRHLAGEFTFVGPVLLDTPSHIVGVFSFEFNKGKYHPSRWRDSVRSIVKLLATQESRLAN